MIQPGDIYRTADEKLLIVVEILSKKNKYSLWSARSLSESMREIVVEDYWLYNLERVS